MFPLATATALAALLASAVATAAPSPGTWEFVPTPLPARGTGGLYGVDVLGASDAWAVGSAFTTAELNGIVYDVTESVTLHWDGAAWTLKPSPNPSTVPQQNLLVAVDAIASDDVWAVGSANNNAGNWGPVAQSLAMHWDGSAWSVVPSPLIEGGSTFEALSALGPHDVWAVGLRNVGAPGPDEAPLTAHWDGKSWNEVVAPFVGNRINRLLGVSARAPGDVWGVGTWRSITTTFHVLIEHWDGSAWRVVPTADPGNNDELLAVAALSADDAWAVGDRNDPVHGSQPLIMHWNGSAWTMQELPVFAGAFNRLNSIRAVSATDIWAAGAFAPESGGVPQPLLVHWNGTEWSVVPAGATDGSAEYLDALGVSRSGQVWTVGSYLKSGRMAPLSERLQLSNEPVGVPGEGPPVTGRGLFLSLSASPNPAPAEARITMVLARSATVRAEVIDLRGRRVRSLDECVASAGAVTVTWDGRDETGAAVAPGLYFARVRSGSEARTARLVVRR